MLIFAGVSMCLIMKSMEIRQLKSFVGIAETGGFSEASKLLYLTQSAISQQIKALEEELGTRLFVRQAHRVVLTDSGRELLPLARRVLEGVTQCYDRINDLRGLLCGELSVGLTNTLEPYVRPTMLRFMRMYPKVKLNIHYKTLSELLKCLREREIDIMLSMMPTSEHDFVESVALIKYNLKAIMRVNHPLAKRESLSFSDLMPHKLILPEKGLKDRNAIDSFVYNGTGNLNVCALVSDSNAILNLLQESNCISILAEHSIANRPSLCAVPITELNRPIEIYAHYNRTTNRKRSATEFVELFRESATLVDIAKG